MSRESTGASRDERRRGVAASLDRKNEAQPIDPLRVRTLHQAAARACISVFTLRRLIKQGNGPRVIQLSERRLGVRDGDFAEWLESRSKVRA
jgi:prophage regulatory protein